MLLLAAFGTVVSVFVNNHASADRVRHTYDVVAELSQLETQLERAENGRRGYLIAPSPYRFEVYAENARLVPQTLEGVSELVSDNRTQVARLRELRQLIILQMADIHRSMALARGGRTNEAVQTLRAAHDANIIRRIREVTGAMRQEEYALLQQRSAAERDTLSRLQFVLGVTGILLLLVAVAAFLLVRRYTLDLAATRDRLNLLNTDLEAAVTERTADLRRANDEIQRFAYIVSHDLRSPLVNILGFTSELESTNKSLGKLIERAEKDAPQIITEDVRNAREDLPEAIGFIRSSTQKMDRLINAILRLSREGRRTLSPEPLEMEAVIKEIAASLEHRVNEVGAEIRIERPIPNMVSDRVAIEQIFSNVIENAVKYLDPARPGRVAVRGRKDGANVIYEIADNGRGIADKDRERVFDLFRRAGTQDQPGEGIGLAHVRALAFRLGGFIDVQSELGKGSTFRLNLPATYVEQGGAA
ncbi:sensor histidine kinase [Sphingomonas lutea]|uniref:sensor histidine kinase n=1 Tax=Sphingomonas lutea TaxID=1045317 RepID=UPI001F2CAD0D|nr:sensor histidine kinase [Sphingomonas lutea]